MNLFLKALEREKTDSIPIWFMRQAGRYLPEYQGVRKDHSFWKMVKTPELAAEITLQPVKRLDVDAAIIFSDIMVLFDGIGIPVSFDKGPPELDSPIKSLADIELLEKKFPLDALKNNLNYYHDSLALTRDKLSQEKALLGFAGSPFTMASYLLEGKTSKTHAKVRGFMHDNPKAFERIMNWLCAATIEYAKIQKGAGIQAFQLFESWGEVLSAETFSKFVKPHVFTLITEISKFIPVIYYNKGASLYPDQMIDCWKHGAAVISVDWRAPLSRYGEATVQGNLDPAILLCEPEVVVAETKKILTERAGKPGFIFNLGHGIMPEARLDSVTAMVETVKAFKV